MILFKRDAATKNKTKQNKKPTEKSLPCHDKIQFTELNRKTERELSS